MPEKKLQFRSRTSRRAFIKCGGAAAAAVATHRSAAASAAALDLVGVWRPVERPALGARSGSWIGLMIITQRHFSRAMMSKDRPALPFDYEKERKLTPEQRDQMVESLRELRAFSGTWEIKDGVLLFHSEVISNMAHLKAPIQRRIEWQGNRLRLWGQTQSGGTSDELWERVE